MACRSPYSESGLNGAGEAPPPAPAAPARLDPPPALKRRNARRGLLASPLHDFVRTSLERRLKQAQKQWRRCAAKPGAGEVHDLRVSLRRFGENLWLFRRLFGRRERRQVRDELKLVMRLTGACRDADIAIESFAKAGVPAGPACRLALENARATAEAALAAALASGLRSGVIRRWRATLGLAADAAKDDPSARPAEPGIEI